MVGTIYSLIPPILVLVCVVASKRVILSISVGIISAALLLNQFNIFLSIEAIIKVACSLFYADNQVNISNILLLLFLFMLGILTNFISKMGGSHAFAAWAKTHIKSKIGAQFIAFFLGIIIFIDDYFNALTVGQIARPLTDEYKVSRTRLAYIIDSTSAPVCVISPLSSWGAYIISLLGSVFTLHAISDSAMIGFFKIIPYNYYAVISVIMVAATILFNINIGKMADYEIDEDEEIEEPTQHVSGHYLDLLAPILCLIIVSVIMIFVSGAIEANSLSIFAILENTNTYLSLVVGATASLLVAYLRYRKRAAQIQDSLPRIIRDGMKSMLSAVLILLFAWALIDFISQIGTGSYLADLVTTMHFNPSYLPALLFIVSGFMALATGTSWGTFGVMIPIAAQMAVSLDASILYVCLGAVLSGSVFGDHCSPISDTTILSSAGAKCHHIDHVTTQLPYAFSAAAISILSFVLAGSDTHGILPWIGIVISMLAFIFLTMYSQKLKAKTASE